VTNRAQTWRIGRPLNRLVIANKPASEPHHFDIAAGLALEPAARLHPVEIAVDV
jgi:hypothetical protein